MTSAGPPGTPAAVMDRRNGLEVMTWPELDGLGVDAVVTTRAGGVSTGAYESLNVALHVGDDPDAVVENRRRAAAALGADLGDLVFGAQVHRAVACVVTAGDAGRGSTSAEDALAGTDVLVTAAAGPVLVTMVADCVPIVLVDPVARVLAAVHAGWRGSAGGAAAAALHAMRALGARPEQVVAGIGPAVSARTYTVGHDVAGAVCSALGGDAGEVLAPAAGGRWLVDLPGVNRVELLRAGVPPGQVLVAPFTTGDGRFYSDRAERPCGRFALLARLR